MRLNAFFAKPKAITVSDEKEKSKTAPGEGIRPAEEVRPPTDYELEFRPFFLQSHTSLPPIHRFQRDEQSINQAQETLDSALRKGPSSSHKPSKILKMKPQSRRLYSPPASSVREILHMLHNPKSYRDGLHCNNPIDIFRLKPEEIYKGIAMKTLQFAEDVRPPYQGTFSRPMTVQDAIRLCRNPFRRVIPGMNYDYDSEAEWDDPEEGEDLDSDDGDEELDEEDEDMEGFLDDGDDELAHGRKKIVVGDLEPVSTGLMFETAENIGDGSVFRQYRLEVINGAFYPCRNNVFGAERNANNPADVKQNQTEAQDARNDIPEQSDLTKSAISSNSFTTTTTTATITTTMKAKRAFPPEQLAEFKQVIQGSNLTKAGLTEVLKKRFPKISKDTIRDTLSAIAVRHGQKEVDKKWILI
ncbi:hypothetical protein KEM54_003236 [Ascosphaera aggregata]|nr:hypothetical protein KEM54_003236 [Ascosphaera aggregata]